MLQAQEVSQDSHYLPPVVAPKGVAASEPGLGIFTILEEGQAIRSRIEVKPGHRLSLQMHHHRSEHWIVVSGTAKVTYGDQVMLSNNQSTYTPVYESSSRKSWCDSLVLIEVQNGSKRRRHCPVSRRLRPHFG